MVPLEIYWTVCCSTVAADFADILSVILDDSLVANVGSSRDELDTPSGTNYLPDSVVDSSPSGMDTLSDVLVESPPPEISRSLPRSTVEVVSNLADYLTRRAVRRSPGPVPY